MNWQRYLQQKSDRSLVELIDFCRIPSISTDPDHTADCRRGAEWVVDRMHAAGLQAAEVIESRGHPVAYGEHLTVPGAPTVMVYGHYDVQPVDPVSDWTTPPFEPEVREGCLFARGASDDKGNMLSPILAAEAHLRTDDLPLNVKFFFEGEEEIGSPNLPPVFDQQAERFACDVVYSADGYQWGEDQPSLTTALRGICGVQIDVSGPERDLHSGAYGGTVHNPAAALSRIISSLVDGDGRVLVDGFYDGVADLSDEDRGHIAAVPFDEAEYLRDTGAPTLFGETGFTTRERNWARPSLEIDGMWSGATGEGRKAIIPASAHAKISCRLVAGQTPAAIVLALRRHVAAHTPPGVRAAVVDLRLSSEAYQMPVDHPANDVATTVLRELYGRDPYYTRTGGTIAILNMFRHHLQADTVMFAFGLHDENAHAPDEFFRLTSFTRAQNAYGRLFEILGAGALQKETT
ncbi:MAG TPA: dipeptidase [Candidatus Latescibacteria bacterium]|jgi:acetylornithine deacetylase/succinyl-diaminopimelate desuccinylase-like protein|nr:peptidase M20 [Gemmatimonadaceae bacterium]MDP6017053.1 dipeptidase [Candidatus Latescibacterota bacterium]HJP29238.1 dipeptidase [Candidatus Latescibacterota bacterium]